MMNARNKTLFLIGGCIIALLMVIGVMHLSKNKTPSTTNNATVIVTFSVTDSDQMSLRINNKVTPLVNLTPRFSLAPGTYTFAVKKPGYSDFSKTFTVSSQQVVTLNINLVRTEPVPQISSMTQIQPAAGSDPMTTWSIASVRYFDDGVWAFIDMRSPEGIGSDIIAHYDTTTKAWFTVLGPATIFPSASLQVLPTEVVNFLQQNNYVTSGAS